MAGVTTLPPPPPATTTSDTPLCWHSTILLPILIRMVLVLIIVVGVGVGAGAVAEPVLSPLDVTNVHFCRP